MAEGRAFNRRAWVKAAGWVLGLALTGAAVWFALRGVDAGLPASVGWRTPAWMALLVAGNLAVTTVLFWSVTRVFPVRRTVGLRLMGALIAASALLNYLPAVRAGLVGRSAYLKRNHGLAWKHSAIVLLVVLVLSVVVSAVVAGPVVVGHVVRPDANDAPADVWVWAAVGVLLLLAAGVNVWATRWLPSGGARARGWSWAWIPMRASDLALGGGRLWLAFAALGSPIGYGEAVVMSAASLLIRLIGLTPNGLGLSEWAVVLLSGLLSPVEQSVSAVAALLDRAVEVAVVVVTGLPAVVWLGRRMGQADRNDNPATDSHPGPFPARERG